MREWRRAEGPPSRGQVGASAHLRWIEQRIPRVAGYHKCPDGPTLCRRTNASRRETLTRPGARAQDHLMGGMDKR